MSGNGNLDRARHLMMARLDGELGAGEADELDRLLTADAELRAEWEKLRRVREVTETMRFRTPPDEIWDTYWTGVYNRFERGLGWLLVSVGAMIVLSLAGWEFLRELLSDAGMSRPVRIGVLALLVGLIVLGVSVVREKLLARRHDPYKEIQR